LTNRNNKRPGAQNWGKLVPQRAEVGSRKQQVEHETRTKTDEEKMIGRGKEKATGPTPSNLGKGKVEQKKKENETFDKLENGGVNGGRRIVTKNSKSKGREKGVNQSKIESKGWGVFGTRPRQVETDTVGIAGTKKITSNQKERTQTDKRTERESQRIKDHELSKLVGHGGALAEIHDGVEQQLGQKKKPQG